ncbi:hypothetical protein [Mycobacteroides abscessus]|uniref:hypothetical protein n=1 Tax=Mycobacteroides abscessus TaxID=36809 RepID=UPI001056332A|nr:hypothetical protein [Mycobacteroides abscessus]
MSPAWLRLLTWVSAEAIEVIAVPGADGVLAGTAGAGAGAGSGRSGATGAGAVTTTAEGLTGATCATAGLLPDGICTVVRCSGAFTSVIADADGKARPIRTVEVTALPALSTVGASLLADSAALVAALT